MVEKTDKESWISHDLTQWQNKLKGPNAHLKKSSRLMIGMVVTICTNQLKTFPLSFLCSGQSIATST